MQCTECGASVGDDADYCTECGAALDGGQATSPGSEQNSAASGDRQTTDQQSQGTGDRTRKQRTADQPPNQGAADQPSANRQPNRAPPRAAQQSDSGWATSRLLAAGGGVLAGVSLFLPWVTAVRGGFSANGMATEFSPIVMAGAAAVLVAAVVNWGRGWGWLSMIFTGLAGVGVASAAFLFRDVVSETATFGVVKINGNEIPIAAVQPATGVQVAIVAGALVTLASLAGIVGSLTSS